MKMFKRLGLMLAVVAFAAGFACAQTRGRAAVKSTTKIAGKAPAAAALKNPTALWVNFNGGEDVVSLAHDDVNVYVTLLYSKRMIVINKTSGKISQVAANSDVRGVVVANNKCYYCVNEGDVYRYNPKTGQSEGPICSVSVVERDMMAVSPNGKYIYCGQNIIDVETGRIISSPGAGFERGVNDVGGVYWSNPEPNYTPLNGEPINISERAVVNDIYPDAVTGNTFWCCEQGVGYTPMVPAAGAGIKRVLVPGVDWQYVIPHHIARDDEGNLIITTNKGIIFGGKTLEDNGTLVDRLKTGVKNQYGTELTLNYFPGLVQGDGMGNIVFGDTNYSCICIYNPKGLKGYADLKGKAVRF